jgi:hypothetical protein
VTTQLSRLPDHLDDHMRQWLDAGLIDAEQAERIEAFEAAGRPRTRRVPLAAELLTYLGGVVSLVGGGLVVGQAWEDLPLAARIAVGLVVAAAGFIAGWRLSTIDEPGAWRLTGATWVLGSAGTAFAVGVATAESSWSDEVTGVLVGVTLLGTGLALWRNLDRPLQFLTAAAGVMVAALATTNWLDVPKLVVGLGGIGLGACIAAMAATHRLQPIWITLPVGSLVAMISAAAITDLQRATGFAIGAALGAATVGVGLWARQIPTVVVGVLGFMQYLIAMVSSYFTGPLASAVVLVIGLALVAGAVRVVTRRGKGSGETLGKA